MTIALSSDVERNMGKDYAEGYQQAREDGGNNRLAMRAFKRLLNVSAYFPGFEARDAEFFDGYKDGVRDSVRVIQTTATGASMNDTQGRGHSERSVEITPQRPLENKPATEDVQATTSATLANLQEQVKAATYSTLNRGSSMSATSFSHQVELLQNLKQYLGDFQERLLGVSANYQRKVDELHCAGMMDETYARYIENELAQTQAMIARLVDHISASDIPTVEREISYLESH
ncbi:MAG: hypothetical protein QJT81_12840 [Candidatus Thiothrix putei]|uniref:Uncharacterized protein n=1 Tax=Candidatus Thiothrix putei TaxID=3080811 RepID=A0AA95H8D2_9GAMM|nr:MAG: hypothetical protein QJT81_12840 [Candidatus Thiothrix putei]